MVISSGRAQIVLLALVVLAAALVAWLVMRDELGVARDVAPESGTLTTEPRDTEPQRRAHVTRAQAAEVTHTAAVVAPTNALPADPDDVVVRVLSPDGEPVAGAQVLISGWSREIGGTLQKPLALGAAKTNDAGVGRLSPRRPARMVILAREGELAGWTDTIALDGAGTREVEITLGPARAVSGRAVDQFGAALADLEIVATLRPKQVSLHRHRESVVTAADGTFTIPAVPNSFLGGATELEVADSKQFLRCVSRFEASVTESGWKMCVARPARLRARVTLPDGEPAAGCGVAVRLIDGGRRRVELIADENGFVDGRVPAGRVDLTAILGTAEGRPSHSRELVIPERGMELGTIVLDGEGRESERERRRNAREGR